MSLTRLAVSGVKWNSGAMVARIGVQFLSLAVLARLLSPQDFGLMGMAVVVTGFAQAFVDFGLGNAIIHRQNVTREQLSSLYWLNLTVGFAIFAGLWLATPLAVAYYQEPGLTEVLHWAIASFLFVPVGQQFQSLLRRELRFRTLSLIQIADSIVYATSAIGLAIVGYGVMSLVWAALLRALVATSLLVAVGIRSHWVPSLHFRLDDLRGFIGFGLFQMGERSLNYLATNVDYLIIGRFLGADALGYYTLAYNLVRLPHAYVNPVIVSIAFPAFARVQDDSHLIRRGYTKIIRYLSVVTFPTMLGMFVVAPLFVTVIYGEQWLPSVLVVQIFCLVGIWKSLGNPLGSILLAKGRADLGFGINLIALIGYSFSNIVGVGWGINGVAFSTLIFQTLILVPIDFYTRWCLIDMRAKEYWGAIRQSTFASVAMFAILFPLSFLLSWFDSSISVLVLLVLTGVTIYVFMIYWINPSLTNEVWRYIKPSKLQS